MLIHKVQINPNKLFSSLIFLMFFFSNVPIANGLNILSLRSGENQSFKKIKLTKDRTSVKVVTKSGTTTYKAEEINYIQKGKNKKYVSKKVRIKNKTDFYLLRQLEEGQVNLYAYKDLVYFIESEDKPIEKLYFIRKEVSTSNVDTLYKFRHDEGRYFIDKPYLTKIQDHVGSSIIVSENLKLKEGSIRKVIQNLNQRFQPKEPKSFMKTLIFKRLSLGAVGSKFYFSNKRPIQPQLGLEVGSEYSGMITTGYLNFTFNLDGEQSNNNLVIDGFLNNISFGIRQYLFANKPVNPFIGLGVQHQSISAYYGILLIKNNYFLGLSINAKNDILNTDINPLLEGLFQVNIGYQF